MRCKLGVSFSLVGALIAAAASSSTGASASVPGSAARRPIGSVTVSAAASLAETFTEIGKRFEKKYEDTDVTFNFDASSALVLQIQGGAPVDVFAAADETSMDKLVDEGQLTAKPVVFARNELEIAVKPGNPEKVTSLADLGDVGIVSLCAREAPCGKYADAVLEGADVTIPPDRITRGQNAKATLTAVSAGDAEAAIVYVTDVETAGASVQGVEIPPSQNEIATYPIAPLADAGNPATARAFAKYVASPAGQRILARHGFLAP